MAKSAFAHWNNRIAPVFDVARHIHIVEVEAGRITADAEEVLADGLPVHKAARLAGLRVSTLVCGAISRPMHETLLAHGIEVIPFVAGDLGEVIQAWLSGRVKRRVFAMPGCGGRGRRLRRGSSGASWEESAVKDKTQGGVTHLGGPGQGGPGLGRGGPGRGRMGGPRSAGAVGTCACPACGHLEPHQRGVPCVQTRCPKCGTAMTRGSAE